MKNITHSEMVTQLCKPGVDIVKEMTADEAHALHMSLGIAGEAGEIVDAVKKVVIYGKPIDIENIVEELDDLEFYMEGLRQVFGIDRDMVLNANIKKLSVRYADFKYSNNQAINRKDKSNEG